MVEFTHYIQKIFICFAVLFFVAGCSNSNINHEKINCDVSYENASLTKVEDPDPLKTGNKLMFAFNMLIDRALLRNASIIYRTIFPEPARDAIHNAFRNLREPLSSISYIFAGEIGGSVRAFWRFVINSTIGIFGLFDPATKLGIRYEDHNFDHTLRKWGLPRAPYIVLPLLGSSSISGMLASASNFLFDPFVYIFPNKAVLSQTVSEAVSDRSEHFNTVDSILYKSIDPYGTVKDNYLGTQPQDIEDDILDEEDLGNN